MKINSFSQFTDNAARSKQIFKVLTKYGLANWVKENDPEYIKNLFKDTEGESVAGVPLPKRLRLALTELGTTFIKLGQVVSTRADIVGPEIAGELEHLQSDTPSDSPKQVQATLEEEFQSPFDTLFLDFNFTPLASASIGQVHEAVTIDGKSVVVKVQHADIESKVRSDLEILSVIARLAEEYDSELKLYQPTKLIESFSRSLLNELDYRKEARYIQRAKSFFSDNSHIYVPKIYQTLSGKRVMTMEKLKGLSISKTEELNMGEYDLPKLAKYTVQAYLDMVFKLGFFHADPHPGNLWVTGKSQIAILDWGMTGSIDNTLKGALEQLLIAAAERDSAAVTHQILQICSVSTSFNRDHLQSDVSEFIDNYLGVAVDQLQISEVLDRFTTIIRENHLLIPANLSLLLRVLIMLEGSSRLLDKTVSIDDALKPYARQIKLERLSPKFYLNQTIKSSYAWQRVISKLPDDIERLTKKVDDGSFDINLKHRHLEAITNRLVYGLLSGSIFLGGCMVLSQSVPPLINGVSILGAGITFVGSVMAVQVTRAITKSGSLYRKK